MQAGTPAPGAAEFLLPLAEFGLAASRRGGLRVPGAPKQQGSSWRSSEM